MVAYWSKCFCILTISFTVVLAKRKFRQAWADLEKAGFTKIQAEESVKLLMEILKENLASKTDLKEAKTSLRNEIKDLRNEMNTRFLQMDHKIDSMESRLLFKLGGLMILIQGAFVTLAKFI